MQANIIADFCLIKWDRNKIFSVKLSLKRKKGFTKSVNYEFSVVHICFSVSESFIVDQQIATWLRPGGVSRGGGRTKATGRKHWCRSNWPRLNQEHPALSIDWRYGWHTNLLTKCQPLSNAHYRLQLQRVLHYFVRCNCKRSLTRPL